MAHGNIEAGEGSMSEDRKRPVIVKSQASSESVMYGVSDRTRDVCRAYLPPFFSSFFSLPSPAKAGALNVTATATAIMAINMLFIIM